MTEDLDTPFFLPTQREEAPKKRDDQELGAARSANSRLFAVNPEIDRLDVASLSTARADFPRRQLSCIEQALNAPLDGHRRQDKGTSLELLLRRQHHAVATGTEQRPTPVLG
jgi:hypothetical protein